MSLKNTVMGNTLNGTLLELTLAPNAMNQKIKNPKETLCLVCGRYIPNKIWHRKRLPHWKECQDAFEKSGLDIWTYHTTVTDSPYRYYYDKH